jgi:protein SCO1/2
MFGKKSVTASVIVAVAFLALFAGFFVSQKPHRPSQLDLSKFHGTFLSQAREVSPFLLTGIDGKPFNNASLHGHWTMVFFGFTNCGSVCPTTMAELGKTYRILEQKMKNNLPQFVMISVDPDRDSIEKLNHYVKAFDPHFYGARGDAEAIKSMTKEMGIAYAKINSPGDDPNQYDIEHTGTVMLFNPKGELSAFFTTPHQASLLAKDYLMLTS